MLARAPPISLFVVQTLMGWCGWHRCGDLAIALLLGFGGSLRVAETLPIQSLQWVESDNGVRAMPRLPSTRSGAWSYRVGDLQ